MPMPLCYEYAEVELREVQVTMGSQPPKCAFMPLAVRPHLEIKPATSARFARRPALVFFKSALL